MRGGTCAPTCGSLGQKGGWSAQVISEDTPAEPVTQAPGQGHLRCSLGAPFVLGGSQAADPRARFLAVGQHSQRDLVASISRNFSRVTPMCPWNLPTP